MNHSHAPSPESDVPLTTYLSGVCLQSLLEAQAAQDPDAIAIAAPGRAPLTYSRLCDHIGVIVRALNALGLGRNDRVAIVLPNGPEMAVAFLSVAAGATAAPLNPAYRAGEFDFYLADLNARALLVQTGMDSPAIDAARARSIPVLELSPLLDAAAGMFTLIGDPCVPPLRDRQGGFARSEDVALVLHTSGTTSRPKIVPLTQANICASAHHTRAALQLTAEDRCLNIMPLFHIHGLIGATLSSLAAGASVACTPGFYAPQFFEWMEEFGPTWYTAVPTMHQAILGRAAANREIIERCPLRLIRSSSAALPPQVMAELESTFKAPVIEAYGMTEAAHQMTSNCLPPGRRKPGSVGVAAGPEVAIMDEEGRLLPSGATGEIVIRGTNVAAGYANNPAANESAFTNGWFRTGDQGFLDADGYLFIAGRLKEIINRGGEKISPREVDEVLLNHPAVAQAVTFAMPDARLGEDVAAAVVLHENAAVAPGELRAFAASHLADFKVPRQVLIVDAIPKGPTGKLQRIGLAGKLGLTTEPVQSQVTTGPVGPRTPIEEALVKIWVQVLGVEWIGIHDNFFDLGGDSMLATQIASRIQQALQVGLAPLSFFEASTVAAMAELVESLRREEQTPQAPLLGAVQRESELSLSFAQERQWFLHQLEPESPVYNRPSTLRLTGSLDIGALERSLNEILRRHEVLRTTFFAVQGRPYQSISPARSLAVPVVDLTRLPEDEREAEAARLARQDTWQAFDLAHGPVLRVTLMRLSTQEHVLLLTVHHIAFDGWSMGVFIRELATLYEAFAEGKPSPLRELPIQYADFAHWQRQWLQGEVLESQLAYWKQQLSDGPTLLELPTDRPRPPLMTPNGARQPLTFSKSLSIALKEVSREEGATLFMTLLAAFGALLYRYTGQDDIIIGTPTAGRNRVETEELIGFFVNTLALRSDLSGNPTCRELIGRVREMALGAYAHQDLPFEKLVEELQPERRLGHTPLFQAMFVLKNALTPTGEVAGLTLSPWPVDSGIANLDLALELWDEPEGLSGYFEYNTELFDGATIARMAGHFQVLLEGIVANPEQPLSALPLLTAAERHQLLVEWNDTTTEYPRDACLHELFEAQVEKTPDAVAVIFGEQQLTYRELNQRANQLAHYLQKQGVGPESLVGICVERSLEMVVGLLGILKAGAAYVPLDPTYPQERLSFMIEDTQIPVLLTQQRLVATLSEHKARVVRLDTDWKVIAQYSQTNPDSATTAESLAYVMYTSGSTGQPKGVCGPHRAVVRLVQDTDYVGLRSEEVFLQLAPLAFDASTFEIWGALLNGARLVIFPPHSPSLSELGQVLQRHQVTTLWLTAGLFHQMVEDHPDDLSRLRQLLAGGDVLSVPHVQKALEALDGGRLINGYGPTENTTFTCCHPMTTPAQVSTSVPIGRPIANTRVYILDRYLQPVPIGVSGELHISGDGLARGYLNRPELTAEKFIANPLCEEPGARLYKTGDLARYLPDGNIEFLGRLDQQVKLRGYRIELGEIEAVLSQHPAVREAVVLARQEQPDDKRLVAYVVAAPAAALAISELRHHLQEKLPEYMVPAALVLLEALPLTPNGKVDRRALPAPDQERPGVEAPFVASHTPIEAMLADIWKQVLRLERVGVHDNFFELGGHSLLATQVMSRLRGALQVELPLRTLFEAPTVAGLAQHLGVLSQPAVGSSSIAASPTAASGLITFDEGRL